MKRFTGTVLILLCFIGQAQESKKQQYFYTNGGLSIGNFSGIQVGINYAVNNKFLLQLEYSGVARRAQATPDNYSGRLSGVFSIGLIGPTDNINSFRLLAGKMANVNTTGNTRLNILAGFSYSTFSEACNFAHDPDGGLGIFPNYSWDTRLKKQFGLIFKPELEFIFSNFIGFAISPYLEISSDSYAIGLALNLLLGKIRNWK